MKFYALEEDVQTCFSFNTIGASINQMKAKFGEPFYKDSAYEKVQNKWCIGCETDDGEKYKMSIYDWKEYRVISENEKLIFHIGVERDVFLPEEVVTALLTYLNE